MSRLRILDLSRVLAGPWATQHLADQGADVIKVEPPEGDETRSFGPQIDGESTYFLCANRNKRDIVLDLKAESDRATLIDLARGADVLLENYRPGVAERLGVGWDTLRIGNPRLVYVAIRAFGEDIPGWSNRPGYDLLLQHMGGSTSLTGFPGSPPTKHGSSIADLVTGLFAIQAMLQGVLHQRETGEGQRVVINMMHVQAQVLAYHASRYLVTGQVDGPRGNAHGGIVPYDTFPCADGWFVVACANDAQWRRLREALALEDDPAWRTNPERVADRHRLSARIAERVSALPMSALDELFAKHGVPGGPVLNPAQALHHPAVTTVEMEHAAFGRISLPGPAYTSKTTRTTHRAPPGLDEDREDIRARGWGVFDDAPEQA